VAFERIKVNRDVLSELVEEAEDDRKYREHQYNGGDD